MINKVKVNVKREIKELTNNSNSSDVIVEYIRYSANVSAIIVPVHISNNKSVSFDYILSHLVRCKICSN